MPIDETTGKWTPPSPRIGMNPALRLKQTIDEQIMSDRLNISHCANSIAAALYRAAKDGHVSKIGIDDIRCAVIGYLAAGPHILSKYDTEQLIDATLRKVVERVG